MARTGLAALTGGVQEGYEAVDEAKKRKQIRQLLGDETARRKRKGQAEQKDIERLYPGEFDFETFQQPETYGQKALGWVKGLFTPEQAPAPAQAVPAAPAPAQPFATPPAAAPRTSQAIPTYAHGGAVRTMQKKYADGGKVEEDGLWDDIKRNTFPETRRRYREWDEGSRRETSEAIFDAEGAEAKGAAIRDRVVESGKGLATIASGVLEDTGALPVGRAVERGISATVRGAKGFLGLGGDEEAAVKALPTDPTPEQDAETALPPEATTPQQAPAAAPAAAPGGEERDIDFSSEARQVMPEDIPSHSSKDWEDERNYWAASAIMKGEDPFKAMEKVDAQQLDGFSRYAMQATALIDGGDMEGATRALYAAYQYFPNGKDVRFGIQQGKDGNRQIIAMGSEEGEDGKSSGPPQILNGNTISRMVENMKKPGALRAWTTDWQATEAKLWEQGYKKDQLRERGRHNRAMEGIGRDRVAAAGRSGGPKQSDFDRANTDFLKAVEMESFDNEEQADWMMSKMSEIYANFGGTGAGGLQYPTVIEQVRAAIRTGDFSELDRLYGIQ